MTSAINSFSGVRFHTYTGSSGRLMVTASRYGELVEIGCVEPVAIVDPASGGRPRRHVFVANPDCPLIFAGRFQTFCLAIGTTPQDWALFDTAAGAQPANPDPGPPTATVLPFYRPARS